MNTEQSDAHNMSLAHNHREPNTVNQYKCEACDAIKSNLMPSEDGLYREESEDKLFMDLYWLCFDSFERHGQLMEIQTSHGIAIDNTNIVRLTRLLLKMKTLY